MNKFWIHAVGLAMAVGASTMYAPRAQAETQAQYVQTWDTTWAIYQAEEALPLAQRGVVVQSQDLSIVINRPIDEVYDIYANVDNALGIHPFLAAIIPIRHTYAGCVPTFDFVALENIPLPDGTIYPGVTVAQQRFHEREHYYDADSYDVPGVLTHQHIVFSSIDHDHTQVVEHLTFEAPPAYIAESVQGGVYAHELVQAGLKAAIESGTLKWTPTDEWIEGDRGGAHDHDGDGDCH